MQQVLDHLRALVGFDTRNPPRAVAAGQGVFAYLAESLPGFDIRVDDYRDGCIALYAVRGQPSTLFNFHIDTVPAAPGWSQDPLALKVDDRRATGLGACDIKGAAACMLDAIRRTDAPAALLFTSDEEAGDSRCVRRFLETGPAFETVIVAEPTRCTAVSRHRGIVSARATFDGNAGHASEARALTDSAIHRAIRWAGAALDLAGTMRDERVAPLQGVPFNIGRIDGGDKPNMIAASCTLRFGFRPLPGQDPAALLDRFAGAGEAAGHATFETVFTGPPLPSGAMGAADRAHRRARQLGLEPGPAVDFWTEASLFSAAGATALVLGPGDIAQAHTAGEWVALDQLATMAHLYRRILDHGH